ncbi:MAG: UDP-N-acetylmuramate--L-alanine ligase [Candidatus Coatesbacteria bacterium]|nr:UDP-N-acetylmuramate--L-alanine ligase [Candidatus Coatesbacteria bacterium]
MFTGIRRVHLIGIGGSGMSSIADVLLRLGYQVSGSDLERSEILDNLEKHGARVFVGHSGGNVSGTDLIVFSNAISQENPEMVAAREHGIPVIPRAEMLAGLMRMSKQGIAVAGTHGKTSTACMIAEILRTANLDPTVIIGGIVSDLGSGGRLGTGDILVAEACESDGTILKLSPTIGVITSLEREHMERYESEEDLFDTFVKFANEIPFYGTIVMCLDQPNLQALIPRIKRRILTYGLTTQSDVMAKEVQFEGFTSQFDAYMRQGDDHKLLGRIRIASPGKFSVYNALAAITTGLELNIEFKTIVEALGKFGRPKRRFELRGECDGIMVVVDYGHHPTEIRETLRAAKLGWQKRVLVAFQPHRFSRTKDLLTQFFTAFNEADYLVITPIYAAGEKPIEGIDGRKIFEGVHRMGHKRSHFVESKSEAVDLLVNEAKPGDMILILGAGDIHKISSDILGKLKGRCKEEEE